MTYSVLKTHKAASNLPYSDVGPTSHTQSRSLHQPGYVFSGDSIMLWHLYAKKAEEEFDGRNNNDFFLAQMDGYDWLEMGRTADGLKKAPIQARRDPKAQ